MKFELLSWYTANSGALVFSRFPSAAAIYNLKNSSAAELC